MKTRCSLGLVCTALIAALAVLPGCKHKNDNNSMSSKSTTNMGAMNDKCCCGAPANSAYTETWNGHKIAFCSKACENMFGAKSSSEKDAAVAKVTANR